MDCWRGRPCPINNTTHATALAELWPLYFYHFWPTARPKNRNWNLPTARNSHLHQLPSVLGFSNKAKQCPQTKTLGVQKCFNWWRWRIPLVEWREPLTLEMQCKKGETSLSPLAFSRAFWHGTGRPRDPIRPRSHRRTLKSLHIGLP